MLPGLGQMTVAQAHEALADHQLVADDGETPLDAYLIADGDLLIPLLVLLNNGYRLEGTVLAWCIVPEEGP